MIREGRKLPPIVNDRIPVIIEEVSKDSEVVALFSIGFSYNIIFSGRLLYCSNRPELVDFMEKTVKFYLDFKFFRDEFDRAFLEGIGYHG